MDRIRLHQPHTWGQRSEPLCSRVYRQPPSLWRSFFMALMDRMFRETAHCENIHLRWRDRYGA
ncbi:hypothetical protein ACFSS8_07315 [Paracoccus kondratievae]